MVKYFQIAAHIAAIGGIIFTAVGYSKNNKIKRGEWLKALFEKFYELDTFGKVRQALEYSNASTFLNYDKNGIAANKENEEAFVNYLNFFEFIAMLIKENHL